MASEKITENSCLEHIGAGTSVGHLRRKDLQVSGKTGVWEETSQDQD